MLTIRPWVAIGRRGAQRCLPWAALVLTTACREAATAYGPDAASARTHFDALASAWEQRFTHVVRTPKFLNARMRIARYAFAPSKLVQDTALWTAMRTTTAGGDRELEVSGALADGKYVFTARPLVAAPIRVGDSRHFIALSKLATDDDWRWTTTVDHAVGSMPPARAADIMRALFASAERPAADVRADYRSAFPRGSAAFGRLFSIDSLVTVPQSDGSTVVTMHVLASDQRVTQSFPALVKFIRKYVGSAKYSFRLVDKHGGEWFDLRAAKSRTVVTFRSHDGALQPLNGAARRMPDTLTFVAGASAKFGLFTVGMEQLSGEFVHVNTANEQLWVMRFTKEPHWDLPLLAEQLLHAPLKRPFEGRGALFRLGFVRGPSDQTILTRTAEGVVNESAIMRYLGNLGFTAMSDYAGIVEEEENRFLAEGMAALRADISGR